MIGLIYFAAWLFRGGVYAFYYFILATIWVVKAMSVVIAAAIAAVLALILLIQRLRAERRAHGT